MPTAKSIGLFALACGSSSATAYSCYSISSSLSDGDGKGSHVGGSGTSSSDVSSTHKSTGDSAAQEASELQDSKIKPNLEGETSHVGGGTENINPPLSGPAGKSAAGVGGTAPETEQTQGGENSVDGNPSGSPSPEVSAGKRAEGAPNQQPDPGTSDQKANLADTAKGNGSDNTPKGDSPAIGDQGASSPGQAENPSPQGAGSSTDSTDQANTSIQQTT